MAALSDSAAVTTTSARRRRWLLKGEGWIIFQRKGESRYLLRYKVANKRKDHKVPRHVDTLAVARAYAEAKLPELLAHGGAPRLSVPLDKPKGLTVREVAQEVRWGSAAKGGWLALRCDQRDRDRLAASTVAADVSNFNAHVLPALGALAVADVDVPRLREFVRGLERKPLAPYTIRNVMASVRTFFDDVKADQIVPLGTNPARDREVVRLIPRGESRAQRRGLKVVIEKAHAEKLLTHPTVPEIARLRYLLGFLTGARDGELAGLTWADVRLDADVPYVAIRKAFALVQKPTRPGETKSTGRTKTRSSNRDVPLHRLCVSALRAWKAKGWVERVGWSPRPNDPVLPSEDGSHSRPDSAANIRSDLRAVGLPDSVGGLNITFHATRATFITWLGQQEVAEAVVQRLVGQTSSSVMAKHYMDIPLERLHRAVEKLSLNLEPGRVIAMPLRVVGGEDVSPTSTVPTTSAGPARRLRRA